MSDEQTAEMPQPESPGAALVRKRWERTTAEQRSEIARGLNRARWGAHRAARKASKKGRHHKGRKASV